MAFPQTRMSLIERLAGGGGDADWRVFVEDYWGPVCGFARKFGKLGTEDAEDVAAETLEVIVKNQLLARWSPNRSAKLRTLICTVVRNVLANRSRVAAGRSRVIREHAGQLDRYLENFDFATDVPAAETNDQFYAAWAEDLVQQTVDGLLSECSQSGCGDRFRVLFGRICEQMSLAEIGVALKMTPDAVGTHFREARHRLSERLREMLRWHVTRYSSADHADDEFAAEWGRLGDYLDEHGGLEAAVRRSYGTLESSL